MAPRAYNNESRLRQQAQLKARIAAAAAELHAAKGAVATSYAEVAQRAGVSLPTVYSHFPSQDDLIKACTGHVAGKAPVFPVQALLAAPDLASAAGTLAEGADRVNAYFEPWVVWREQQAVPALAAWAEAIRLQQTRLIAQVLARHLGPDNHREQAAAWESLLSFEVWHRMSRAHGLARAAVRRIQVQLLLAVTGPQPAATPAPRPRKRKSS